MNDKKEERILIFKVKNPCSDNCEIKDIQSCKTCNVKKRYNEAIGYDTTIDKMAKALCNWYYTACSECALRDKPKECKALLKDANFYEQAESELNALLENK